MRLNPKKCWSHKIAPHLSKNKYFSFLVDIFILISAVGDRVKSKTYGVGGFRDVEQSRPTLKVGFGIQTSLS